MTELQDIQTLFASTAQTIESRFAQQAALPSDVSPGELSAALTQLLHVFDKLDQENGEHGPLLNDDPSELGELGVNIAADLATWADRLALPQAKRDVEKVAVGIALWVVRHQGEIRVLDTIVNCFAAQANGTTTDETLRALFHAMQLVLAHATPALQQDLDKSNPGRPWRTLNFNFAIVATRIQDAQLMHKAFDTLGHNLPEDAAEFFAEGLRQSTRPIYGPVVKNLMQEYFSRWTVRH